MKGLIGIDVDFPYVDANYVGTLLFAQYPTTIILSDSVGMPIIKEWVDCNDDNTVDRFFYYKTDKPNLKKFIEGKMPHIDLINSSQESYVIFQDISGNDALRTFIVSLKSIPADYKPVNDFYFSYEDAVNVIDVIDFFALDDIILPELELKLAKDVSLKSNSETLYFHLNKGKGVGYGTIKTEIFARTLLNFDRLYKNVALDFAKGVTRGDLQLDAQKNIDLLQYTETELFGERIAASYGFFIRPVSPQTSLFIDGSPSEQIAANVFSLIERSDELGVFENEYGNYSGFTINAYRIFLDGVYKSELSFDLNWFNPLNGKEKANRIDYRKANRIVGNIDRLSITDIREFILKGKFRSVNCDTRHYTFSSTNNMIYSGYFDKAIKEAAESANFVDIYEIKISRTITKEAVKQEDVNKDLIIRCIRDNGD